MLKAAVQSSAAPSAIGKITLLIYAIHWPDPRSAQRCISHQGGSMVCSRVSKSCMMPTMLWLTLRMPPNKESICQTVRTGPLLHMMNDRNRKRRVAHLVAKRPRFVLSRFEFGDIADLVRSVRRVQRFQTRPIHQTQPS